MHVQTNPAREAFLRNVTLNLKFIQALWAMMGERSFVQTVNWEQYPWANASILSKSVLNYIAYALYVYILILLYYFSVCSPPLNMALSDDYHWPINAATVQVQIQHICSECSWSYVLHDLLLMTTRNPSKLVNCDYVPTVAGRPAALVNAAQVQNYLKHSSF